MPNIKPVSDLRNYTSVISEVGYGSRVYLTKNGHGNVALIDMRELDDMEKELALYKFKYEMAIAEKSIREEGTISADELEAELGVQLLKKLEYSQIARQKLKELQGDLLQKFGEAFAKKSVGLKYKKKNSE